MRRREFCKVVGIEVEAYKTLARRNQLPFMDVKWRDFDLEDALRLRLALDMSENSGLGPGAAARVVWNALAWNALAGRLKEPLDAANHPEDIFIAQEIWENAGTLGANHYAGTLREVVEQSEKRALDEKPKTERTRIVFANVSGAARFILAQAKWGRALLDDEPR